MAFTKAPAIQKDVNGSPAAFGSPSDEAWNGTDPEASIVAILKYCAALLEAIETNTTPAP